MTQQHTILLVDDEVDLLEMVGSFLELEGYAVLKAVNVPKAWELMKTKVPDLIISDVTMPGQSGFDFFASVRAQPQYQHIPFIFLSGHTDFEHISRGKELGSDDYITKPFDPDLLISTIKGKLKRRQEITDSVSYQLDQMKTQLFNIMSHEMRTPLTSILGATEILSDGKDVLTPTDFKEFLEMLKTSSKRLNGMVEDFLLAVKIESDEFSREIQSREALISPAPFLERLIQQFDEVVQKKQINVRLHSSEQAVQLSIYPPHLENIIQRLLENAFKFVQPQGNVDVTFTDNEKSCTLSVHNDGLGIPKDKLEHIFEKFYQVNRDSHEQQGTGLGLYIASKLAAVNNCALKCESVEGKGTLLTLTVQKCMN